MAWAKHSLARNCAQGPFATKEALWEQIDNFVNLQALRKAEKLPAIAFERAAEWFGITHDELMKTMSSPSFVKYLDARTMIDAKVANRPLDTLAVEKMKEMAKDKKNDGKFLAMYQRRQKLIGFDKVSIEDLEEIGNDEGKKALEAFAKLWRELNDGREPDFWKVLPRLLETQGERKESRPKADSGNNGGDVKDQVYQPGGPDPVVGAVPETAGMPQSGQEIHIHGGGEPSGEV